jgi:GTPase Era involved in 16S rRNA processing
VGEEDWSVGKESDQDEEMSRDYPRFAVVGHPNKGKSSIVSTLALDESVHISSTPGTTTSQRAFPLKIDGKLLYELYDTPGFQRAREVLEWLKREDIGADQKTGRVKLFVDTFRNDPRFHDEIELLSPILGGAGIIYVVDGSKPYGVEYEAEMEILRWCGQPSMALINLIDETDHVEEWKRALGHYFRLVRVFSPMEANFSQHRVLFEAIAQLKEEWTASVNHSMELFALYRRQNISQSAELIASLLAGVLSHKVSQPITSEAVSEQERTQLSERYKKEIRALEEQAMRKIAALWSHSEIEKEDSLNHFLDVDLFSKESESIFGLSKKELATMASVAGGATGAGVDLMLGGSSMMLGALIGGLVGGAGAMFGFDEAAQIKVLGQKLGSRRLEAGPMKNPNFPYILLRRVLYYAIEVANRPHANRKKIQMDQERILSCEWIDGKTKRSLEAFHYRFRQDVAVDEKQLEGYRDLIQSILMEHISN